MATEIIYIDANRQMSKKSDSLNNVWEYQLSDEALVLPAGTQITIQDTFVNKKGAGGQSIEIAEDIDEMVDFGFYINDSPHWIPLAEGTSDPNVADYEAIYDNGLVAHSANNNPIRYARDTNTYGTGSQYKGTTQDTGSNNFGRASTYQAESVGGSNTSFPCVQMNGSGQPDNLTDYSADIRPFTKEVNIFVPKGIYGLTELGTLITDQMTGKLTNVRNGDFQEDYVKKKLNEASIISNRGINDNLTTYVRRNALYSSGTAPNNYTQSYANYNDAVFKFKLKGCTRRSAQNTGIPFTDDEIWEIDVFGPDPNSALGAANWIENPINSGVRMIFINGEYFSYTGYVAARNDGRYGDFQYASFRDIRRGVLFGDTPGDPPYANYQAQAE